MPSKCILLRVDGKGGRALATISAILNRMRAGPRPRAKLPSLPEYLDTVLAAIPAVPFTAEMARIAAKIDADGKQDGSAVPFADLLIGATALHFGYALGTRNLRHFQMIPGLKVIPL